MRKLCIILWLLYVITMCVSCVTQRDPTRQKEAYKVNKENQKNLRANFKH